MEQHGRFAAEERFVVAATEVGDEPVVRLVRDALDDGAFALARAVANHPMAGLADDQVPGLSGRQGQALDHTTPGKLQVPDPSGNAVHRAQPRELADELM